MTTPARDGRWMRADGLAIAQLPGANRQPGAEQGRPATTDPAGRRRARGPPHPSMLDVEHRCARGPDWLLHLITLADHAGLPSFDGGRPPTKGAGIMTAIGCGAPGSRAHDLPRRRPWALGAAAALAVGFLAAASIADARTTRIDIQTRTIAFGGYSFAGVGQFEKITGIATGEVDPNDPLNAVIVDLQLAPKLPNGHVQYRHNFYILKPVNLGAGNHKMMYEPPNRGSKTYATLNRSPGGNDPGAITDPTALANSFLWPRGYTTVWSGWENNLGALTSLTATAELPVAHDASGGTITGPAYEYIVTGAASFPLTYPAASLGKDPASARL